MLESSGFLTQKDIARETYLPARTVRYALNRLKEENILQERFYFQDARQSLYGLNRTLACLNLYSYNALFHSITLS
ncbi:MAG: winged helix-turn-helix domain-containing protein [Candidatus Methanoperedens sp.]|nr:winged helix-turn-helix domain-containing protein [Candidatus Methanoperedens sp.]